MGHRSISTVWWYLLHHLPEKQFWVCTELINISTETTSENTCNIPSYLRNLSTHDVVQTKWHVKRRPNVGAGECWCGRMLVVLWYREFLSTYPPPTYRLVCFNPPLSYHICEQSTPKIPSCMCHILED